MKFTPEELDAVRFAVEVGIEKLDELCDELEYVEKAEPDYNWGHRPEELVSYKAELAALRSAKAKIG